MVTNQNIIDTLNSLLKARGWSVNHLASEANLSQSTISSMLHGSKEYYPSFPTLNKICDALGIRVSEFLCMVENEHYTEPTMVEYQVLDQVRKLSWNQAKHLTAFLEAINFVENDNEKEK